MKTPRHVLIFGLGYSGRAVAEAACAAGFAVTATTRRPMDAMPPADGTAAIAMVAFDAADAALADATHVLATAPPDDDGDPVLRRHGSALAAAPALRWIGYLSSTVVYGDRGGGWVDEDTPPAPGQPRGHRRLAAENGWCAHAGRCAVDVFRLAGIYGPGRSAFDALRAGTARRIDKPDHAFGRIHRDDIAAAVLAAMQQDAPPGCRRFNLADDVPAPTEALIAEAAALLGIAAPPLLPFADAAAAMSPMARSFWAENRKVASAKTQAALRLAWRYPSYREGLRAILRQEPADGPA
jgi:nucleoside-diphosphate-sugar epimerase